ncbi:hypothetical protein M8C21_020120 [Ambrosia artemisiifolia]|uniref:Uncharacterized protein n=1 Tax=Ambrosia artemisiifolia TaxID=4212 RepID=A0AAD5D149_AMBAR|nr:hypothetical protein M8C21_020120 [Ambrosia artemisiifolia]
MRSLVPQFDLQSISFIVLDANSQINLQLRLQIPAHMIWIIVYLSLR